MAGGMPPRGVWGASPRASIELSGLTKRFGEIAVDNIDLSVASGEFFSLLGPSGCGKTTTLRLIAGFEQPTSGTILLDGVDVSGVPPHRVPAMVERVVFLGAATQVMLRLAPGVSLRAVMQNDGERPDLAQGTPGALLPAAGLAARAGRVAGRGRGARGRAAGGELSRYWQGFPLFGRTLYLRA